MLDLLPVSWFRSGAPARRCVMCCQYLGLEVVPQPYDVRFVGGVLVSKWWPNTKMYLLMVSWSRSGGTALRCMFCCRCELFVPGVLEVVPPYEDVRSVTGILVLMWYPRTKMYDFDLLPGSWSRSGALAQRWTMRYRCLDLEVLGVPQHKHVRFVAGILVSKWCPSTKMYNLLPVSWSRSGAPAPRCTICCRYLGRPLKHQRVRRRFSQRIRGTGLVKHQRVRRRFGQRERGTGSWFRV